MNKMRHKWDPQDYAKNSSAQESWANELIAKLALQGNEHLIDIGCGDGKITYTIARKLVDGRVVGLDRSREMISLAKERFDHPVLSFYTMDAEQISVQGKFDVAYSNAALHWVEDHRAVLAGLKKYLNPNAKILFQMGGHGNARAIFTVAEQVMNSELWQKYYLNFSFPYRFCKIADYKEWLPAAGYRANRIELISKDMVHKDREGLKGWLRTTWFPYTDQLPEDKQELFTDLVVDQYLDQHPVDSEGKTHVGMVRLEVEAVRL